MFPCPCCGFLTIGEKPPGTFEICPVCFWEDDNVQFEDAKYAGGANHISLHEAQKNFIVFGAKAATALKFVRKPLPGEIPSTRSH